MTDTLSTEPPRDEIEDMLPWYANGRLGSRDRARVEAALAVDDDLVRRLALIREEMAASVEANEAIVTPSTRIFDRVLVGMDKAAGSVPEATEAARPSTEPGHTTSPTPAAAAVSEPPPAAGPRARPAQKFGLIERLTAVVESFSPRSLAFAGLAAVAIVVAQGAALTEIVLERGRGATYETASQAPIAGSGVVVLVAFVPEAKIADVAAFLARHQAQVLDGPRANGFFKLRVGGAGVNAAAIAEAMRQETAVVSFAQPSS